MCFVTARVPKWPWHAFCNVSYLWGWTMYLVTDLEEKTI